MLQRAAPHTRIKSAAMFSRQLFKRLKMKKSILVVSFLMVFVLLGYGCAKNVPESPAEKIPEPIANVPEAEPELVAETLSFSWEKDGGSRVTDGSVPFVHGLKDGKVRLYYCNNKWILSAISNDRLTFAKESGVRISPGTGFESIVCDPTIVNLPDGKIR